MSPALCAGEGIEGAGEFAAVIGEDLLDVARGGGEGDDVLVNVWRSFPVTARVKLKDGREKTVTKWIDPKAALAQR